MKTLITLLISVAVFSAASNVAAQAKPEGIRARTTPVKVGDTAPDFTLNEINGKPVTLSKLRKPVVLVFYRGYW